MKKIAVLGVAVLAAGAVLAGVSWSQAAHRREYVRAAMDLRDQAEQAYAAGKFDVAASTGADALAKLRANPSWFDAADASRLEGDEAFWRAQIKLWKVAQAATAARDLERILAEAKQGGAKTRPVWSRVEPMLAAATAREKAAVLESVRKQIPLASRAYEEGQWTVFRARLQSMLKELQALPEAERGAAGLDDLAACGRMLAEVDAIAGGAGSEFARADKLRAYLDAMGAAKPRDAALRRDIVARIDALDKETRPPLRGSKLPEGAVDEFAQAMPGLKAVASADATADVLQGPRHRYVLKMVSGRVLVETDRVRIVFSRDLVEGREGFALETAGALSKALRASGHEKALGEEPWYVDADAPGRCAHAKEGEKAWIVLDGIVYEGRAPPVPSKSDTLSAFRRTARSLEEAIRSSPAVAPEIRGPLAAFVRATHMPPEPGDDLNTDFCRDAVNAGYVETQVPKADEALAAKLKEYRDAYAELTTFHVAMEGKAADGRTVAWRTNAEGQSSWRLEDPSGPATTFTIAPRDTMRSSLVAHVVFAGRHAEWPEGVEPVRLRMFHRAAGEISRWDAAGGFVVDGNRWSTALRSDPRFFKAEHFGESDWVVPPHALRVDARGRPTAIVLPGGALAMATFAGEKKREAQDAFLDACAKALRSPGELHLFYRYFVEYVHDSPVTTALSLIGSGKHGGDIHQDAYQTLGRRLCGRYLADCDDLAELYQEILKRQGRLAYVLSVPGHATCGTAEKDGNDWVFFCVDTGPPRQLRGADLDVVLEKVVRTYDDDGDMQFDPRQVHFLFRFAGEQTRTEYLLDSRLFRDAEYAELMIRVQEYWHFHFYALGIETMNTVLKTDRMPANCTELAGLLMRVRSWDEAIKWTDAGIAGLSAADVAARLNEAVRKATCHRSMDRDAEALKVLKAAAADLEAYVEKHPDEAGRMLRDRFDIALAMGEADDPWGGWVLVSTAVRGLRSPVLTGYLTRLYGKMKDLERDGQALTDEQKRETEALGQLLERMFSSGFFRGDESGTDIMRNYTLLYHFFEARDGDAAARTELARRDYPTAKRRHTARKTADAALDWQWIRLSPYAYARAVARALDRKDKKAGGREAAIEILKSLEEAVAEMRKQGSLGTAEFVVLNMRLTRACLEMDEAGMKAVFDEMKRQAWGEIYDQLSRTIGGIAPHLKLEDFEKVFRLFCSYGVPRPHYYGVVYTAWDAEANAHALAASRMCIEKFPKDEDMRREHALLMKLGR